MYISGLPILGSFKPVFVFLGRNIICTHQIKLNGPNLNKVFTHDSIHGYS